MLHPDRYFDPDPAQRRVARELYESVVDLPLICPHGHVDPGLFADEDATFGTPAELLIIPDHYVFRMLYSGDSARVPGHPSRRWRACARGPPPDLAGLCRELLPISWHAHGCLVCQRTERGFRH